MRKESEKRKWEKKVRKESEKKVKKKVSKESEKRKWEKIYKIILDLVYKFYLVLFLLIMFCINYCIMAASFGYCRFLHSRVFSVFCGCHIVHTELEQNRSKCDWYRLWISSGEILKTSVSALDYSESYVDIIKQFSRATLIFIAVLLWSYCEAYFSVFILYIVHSAGG